MKRGKGAMTRKRFAAWLRGRDRKEFIGQRASGDSCPLAFYLRDIGYSEVWVDSYTYHGRTYGPEMESLEGATPEWAGRVIRGVDTGGGCYDGVTAQEVRGYLGTKAD